MLKRLLDNIPRPLTPWVVAGASCVLVVFLFLYGARAWNGVGAFLFHREADALSADVQRQLTEAAGQKKELERALLELDAAKKDLATAKAVRQEAERVLNDKTKTASEKVAAYREALADNPPPADTSGVTTSDLCARAKSTGASAATRAALCGQ